MEYGIFNDEGILEGDFFSREEAKQATTNYSPEDNVRVEEICPDHPDQPKFGCEGCGIDTVGEEEIEEMTEGERTGKDSGFSCMECGHRFKTLKAAERASFGPDGCPKCGGSDIGESEYAPGNEHARAEAGTAAGFAGKNNEGRTFYERVADSHAAKRLGITVKDIEGFMNEGRTFYFPENEPADRRLASNVSMDDIKTIVAAVKNGEAKASTSKDIDGFMLMDKRGLLEDRRSTARSYEEDEPATRSASHADIKKVVELVKRGVPVDRLANSSAAKRMGITSDDIHEFMAMDAAGELDEAKLHESKEVSTDEFDKYMDDILTREALVRKRQQDQQQAPETAQRTYNKRYGELPQNRIRYGVKK